MPDGDPRAIASVDGRGSGSRREVLMAASTVDHPTDESCASGALPVRERAHRPAVIRIGLLGLGRVGAAVARRALSPGDSAAAAFEICGALVRDPHRLRGVDGVNPTTDAESIFNGRPDVIVEALGGLEPARTLVLGAIARGIPVVTANKSLMARHYDEIVAAASQAGVALGFEASVIAGVPFLGTFARRRHAAAISSLVGIVNGTTNFILTAMTDAGRNYAQVLAEAQRLGFAEPDPGTDVRGIDAAEKLAILIRHFAGRRVDVDAIETCGIEHITAMDLALARELGGVLKPVVAASGLKRGANAPIRAFVAPAFVPERHLLAATGNASNALCVCDVNGSRLTFSGPGAGPDVTAVTILDDVLEAVSLPALPEATSPTARAEILPPDSGWFVHVSAPALPSGSEIADFLGGHGVWAQRTTTLTAPEDRAALGLLTYPSSRVRVERALSALQSATGCSVRTFRALEPLL
jgi:homoserine dehydrogenase